MIETERDIEGEKEREIEIEFIEYKKRKRINRVEASITMSQTSNKIQLSSSIFVRV